MLATCDHAVGSLAKTECRVRFCQEVQDKNVEEKLEQDFDLNMFHSNSHLFDYDHIIESIN